MRYLRLQRDFRLSAALTATASTALLVVAVGCASTTSTADLDAGYRALEQKNFAQAIAAADARLAESRSGPGAAEALYLKGRALEEKAATSESESSANFREARVLYHEALTQRPAPVLEGHIRASLGNVAYFQDDYTSAIQHFDAAYPKLDKPDAQAWALYRLGLSQQRLGRFTDADNTFARVQRAHANTVPADRAREHQGARNFQVQLATFSKSDLADAAVRDLRRQGVMPIRLTDPKGRHVIRVGPVSTYAGAKALQSRFRPQFPDAMIVP